MLGSAGSFLELRYTLGARRAVTIAVQPAAGGPAIPLRSGDQRGGVLLSAGGRRRCRSVDAATRPGAGAGAAAC